MKEYQIEYEAGVAGTALVHAETEKEAVAIARGYLGVEVDAIDMFNVLSIKETNND